MKPLVEALLAALCLAIAGTAQAQASLKDKEQLVAALSSSPPCCVIDARAAASRKRESLMTALTYSAKLKINPTATVVVIADRDRQALDVANTLAAAYPGKPIFAVKGGLVTWKATRLSLLLAVSGLDAGMSGPVSFVIPANTCEQGKPLQELRSDRK